MHRSPDSPGTGHTSAVPVIPSSCLTNTHSQTSDRATCVDTRARTDIDASPFDEESVLIVKQPEFSTHDTGVVLARISDRPTPPWCDCTVITQSHTTHTSTHTHTLSLYPSLSLVPPSPLRTWDSPPGLFVIFWGEGVRHAVSIGGRTSTFVRPGGRQD